MNHLATLNYIEQAGTCQNTSQLSYQRKKSNHVVKGLQDAINGLFDKEFRRQLQQTMHHVRSGYLMESIWKAYMLSFILDMDSTNDLVRKLEENPSFAEACGFNMDKPLPSRWTFNRMIKKLAQYPEIIEALLDTAVNQLQQKLPEFGDNVSIDSTPVRSHSNPGKRVKSDPEAGFIVKEGIPHKIWKWGYKLHLLVDSKWELPISCNITLAREADVQNLIPLIDKAKEKFEWFSPWHVTADKGYDAGYNYKAIHDIGATPIIKMRGKEQSAGKYTIDETGIPHCKSGLPLLLKDHDPKKGLRYVCPYRAGKMDCSTHPDCTLKVAWIRPLWEYRKLCSIPRDSEEWNSIYSTRTAVERVNSKLKEHRRLNSHCHRGFEKIKLHCLMSVLSLITTALAEANENNLERVGACTRKIA
ncbi:transposase [Chloroflexota bacterium]